MDEARERVSRAVGCEFAEVIFTSGGTEAMNLALIGTALANEDPHRIRILISAADHHCAILAEPTLTRLGYRVEIIPVDAHARPLLPPLSDDILLVCAMHVNNELGTVTESIAAQCAEFGIRYVLDAVASFGKIDVPVADLTVLAAHKIGGPKGVGALIVRAGNRLKPWIVGGAQERELRGGTENPAAIVGLGAACESISVVHAEARDAFLDRLVPHGFLPTVADRNETISPYAHGRFPGVRAETLLIALDRLGVSASSGAACSSGSVEPSHVMLACGFGPEAARECLRFTFGAETTVAQAEEAATRVLTALNQFR
jgi:cysteine desulfurase